MTKTAQGCLHLLVNDIWELPRWSGTNQSGNPHVDYGLHTPRLGVDTHAITSHFAIPLLIKTPDGLVVELTDGTAAYNETNYFLLRPGQSVEHSNGVRAGTRIAILRCDCRVTHSGLAAIRGHARGLRRHRIELA